MIVLLAKMFGPICVDPEDGGRLWSDIRDALSRDESVCQDFGGVTTLTSSFLNPAIGRLYESFSADDLASCLNCTGLDQTDEAILRLVQSNAIRFFQSSPAIRLRLEAIDSFAS